MENWRKSPFMGRLRLRICHGLKGGVRCQRKDSSAGQCPVPAALIHGLATTVPWPQKTMAHASSSLAQVAPTNGPAITTPLRCWTTGPVNEKRAQAAPSSWRAITILRQPKTTVLAPTRNAAGCTFEASPNYDPTALIDDGSCTFEGWATFCQGDLNGDGVISTLDLLDFLSVYGEACPE